MVFHYHCDRCGVDRTLRYLPREYLLPSGRTLPIEQRHIWCSVCNDITVAESFSRNESILEFQENRLRELRELKEHPPAEMSRLSRHQRFQVENAAKRLAELEGYLKEAGEARREWKGVRTAPQKCLRCGNTEVEVPAEPEASLNHVGCGGTLVCSITVHSYNGPAEYAHTYDPNGALLEFGRKPVRVPGQFEWGYVPMELFQ